MLDIEFAASLFYGLRDESRIKMKIAGQKVTNEIILLAAIVDNLSLLVWAKTEDAEKGINKPESVVKKLLGLETVEEGFDSGKEFEEQRKKLLERLEENGG